MKYTTYFEYIDKYIEKIKDKNNIKENDRKSYVIKRKNHKVIYNYGSNYDNYVRGCS